MWLIRAGLAASFLPIQEFPRSCECQLDVNNKCIRGRIKTSPIRSVIFWKFLTPAVIFAVKLFWIDVYQPPLCMSTCQWLSVNLHVCLSVPVSTSVLPPVSFSLSACLFSLLLPSCLSVKVRIHSGPFNICHIISAREKSIFRDECRLSQGHTHTHSKYLYMMRADSAHRELESSQPSLSCM